jgi:hypothetical protein
VDAVDSVDALSYLWAQCGVKSHCRCAGVELSSEITDRWQPRSESSDVQSLPDTCLARTECIKFYGEWQRVAACRNIYLSSIYPVSCPVFCPVLHLLSCVLRLRPASCTRYGTVGRTMSRAYIGYVHTYNMECCL